MKLILFKSDLKQTELAPEYNYVIQEDMLKNIDIDDLRNLILKRNKEITDGYDITYSRYKFFNKDFWNNNIIIDIEKNIVENVKNYFKNLMITMPEELYIFAWVNVMSKEQQIDPHQHDCSSHSLVSGNICVSTSNTNTYYINPHTYFNMENRQSHTSENQNGKIVVFPSLLPHYTDANLASEKRITIAFDIYTKEHEIIKNRWYKEDTYGDNIKRLNQT